MQPRWILVRPARYIDGLTSAFLIRRETIKGTVPFLVITIRPGEANTDTLLLAPDHLAMLRDAIDDQRKDVRNSDRRCHVQQGPILGKIPNRATDRTSTKRDCRIAD